MDFTIPEEITAIGDALIKFIDREVTVLEDANRELLSSERNMFKPDGRYTDELLALKRQVRMRSAELGFYTLFGPQQIGGEGLGALAATTLQEQLNAHCGPERALVQSVVLPSPFTNGLSPVFTSMDPQVFERYRERLASGDKTSCFCLSEPDAGSDVYAIKTVAERDGDDWVITGTKQWITNSPYADYAMVFAITDKELARKRQGGITGFFVDTRTEGFNVPSVIPLMGHLGYDIGIVTLDGVRVRDDHRLGALNKGLSVALNGVNIGRLSLAGTCIGLARWALEQATEYAKTRITFGRPIAEQQAVQFMLADCAVDIYAAKSMTQNCAWRVDQGMSSTKEVAMVKIFGTEMLGRVMDRCMQVHGGMGLTNELRLEAGYRLARLFRIPDGTSEILRRTVASRLLDGDELA
ncbi:acyl-CoA dehydrogenase [Cupriavidus necator]|uniref:acyl-CoA dehydrogenase family protein n=1 Tax=Cupriavidus necator TaxID=106590 RepID=UPI003ECD9985